MMLGGDTSIIISLWTAVAVVLFAIWTAVKFSTMKESLCYRVSTLEVTTKTKTREYDTLISNLIEKNQHQEIALVEIKTKLANIESLLIDMKTQIKEKK